MNIYERWDQPIDADRPINDGDYAEAWDYEEPLPSVPDWEFQRFVEEVQTKFAVKRSQFVETSILMPDPHTKGLSRFSFDERPYLRKIYDTSSKRVLLMCGRQVEKTVRETELVRLSSGDAVPIRDIEVGDKLVCLETYEQTNGTELAYGHETTASEVVWKSKRYRKPCLRLKTRQGHSSEVALTHPVRTWAGYTEAGELRVGDRIAVVRRAGEFLNEEMSSARVRLTAFMIGDGSCKKQMSFVNKALDVLEDFTDALCDEGMDYTFQRKTETKVVALHLPHYKAQKLYDWFAEDGLLGTDSHTKFIPRWVFRLSREQTALFINRLWSTDGHVKRNGPSKWPLEYCSMSKKLILQLQSLLHKFGIPSKIRENWPRVYKDRGEEIYAYTLRIDTQPGVRAFVQEIGALGKIECADLEPWGESDNQDTFPPEVTRLVRDIYEEVSPKKGDRTLRSCGIERLPREEYCLTADKLRTFVEFFEGDPRYHERKVALLRAHLSADIYWDEVTDIEPLGEQWCYDLTVRDHHNFLAGSVVTHNSTTLGMRILAMTCLIPHFKVLYVSPSAAQTKEFSKTRIKEMLDICPDLRVWFPQHLTDNVFEKRAINLSKIVLRYAFLNADRTRGLSSDLVALDEIQDFILDNIPVIEETASHSPYRYFLYSGTPKSLDNPIEHYWSNFSTQNEWAVPCERHGTPKVPGSWHWNILGEANIGRKGLICDKCGGRIDAQHPMAQWVRTGSPDPELSIYEGFRIPQLMVPWIGWKDLLTKYNDYPRAQFFNEVLGRSFDNGQRPLTQDDLIRNCDPEMRMSPEDVKEWHNIMRGIPLYGGIDWGQDSANSHTVMFVGGYYRGKFRVIFAHRFTGAESDPKNQLPKIMRIIDTFKLQRVGVDHGGGFWPNAELLRKYGSGRITRFQYSSPNVFMRWDGRLGRYIIHRSEVMSAVFNAIKRGGVFVFPAWKDFQTPFAADMLSIYSEYNDRRHMTQYKRSPNNTDDSFHSMLYMFLASMLDQPRPDVFVPNARVDRILSEV